MLRKPDPKDSKRKDAAMAENDFPATDFIRECINADLADGRYDHVHTRFPPEPN